MPRVGSGHKGLTPELVLDAATELTREHGLDHWSVRDLSGRLGVAPSSIYHHVGDRAEVVRRVIGRLAERFPLADPALDWREWFEQTLMGIRAALRGYPGVAHWFMMHGPSLPQTLPIADAGMRVLLRAGFGERAGFAYAVMFNHVIGTVAFGDDRIESGGGPPDRSTLLAALEVHSASSPGVAELVRTVVLPFVTDPAADDQFARDALGVVMLGLATELAVDQSAAPVDLARSEGDLNPG